MQGSFAIAAAFAFLAGCSGVATLPGTDALGPAHVEPFQIEVVGEQAYGLLGVPAGEPTTLVVLAHPWGSDAEYFRPELQRLADAGVLAVAMDFRGEGSAFKVAAGVEDTVATTLALQAEHPAIDRTILYGWSMGGEVVLLSAATAPSGTYDYVLVGAGVTDLANLWHSFWAARPSIETETGGTPLDVSAEYARRSPVERVADLTDKGVSRYFIVHAAGDMPVPIEQAERLYARMADAGLPISYYVVTLNEDPWLCTPVVTACAPNAAPVGLANHEAGSLRLMQPLLDHRLERLSDPAGAIRGTYDGDSGVYEPSDVGS